MEYLFQKIVWAAVQPSNMFLALFAAGLALLALKRYTGAKIVLLCAFVGVAAVTLTPLVSVAAATLEDVYTVPTPLPDHVDGIVVLGGAERIDITLARRQVALNDSSERLIAGAALAQQYPEATLLFTGGRSTVVEREGTAAQVARKFFASLGLDEERLLFEDRSRDTYDNAVLSKELADPREDETWLLVTSAWHMPRAMGVFTAAGWNVVPYPVDYRSTGEVEWGLPRRPLNRLVEFDRIVTEWAGLLGYGLVGRFGE